MWFSNSVINGKKIRFLQFTEAGKNVDCGKLCMYNAIPKATPKKSHTKNYTEKY